MILAEELRKAVLQAAIQGKLVEQRPEEGTGEELYTRIQEEKEGLIKQGKVKKEKALPEISEDDIPFDIPETWKWVRLDEIVAIKGGKRLPKGKSLVTEQTDHIYIRVTDMKNNTVDVSDLHYIDNETYNAISQYIITDSDLYIVIVGSTIGKVGSIPYFFNNMNLTENAARIIPCLMNKDYLLQVLKSDFAQRQFADKTKQVGQPKLALLRLKSALIPLPPLSEQKRICERLEKILPEVDSYASAEQKIVSLQAAFLDCMRKSILQYAMRGKLVEQHPEEGTGEELYQQIQAEKVELIKEGKLKKEKALVEITEDEIPFDIPDTWKWVKFGELSELISGSDLKPEKYNDKRKGIPYITGASNINDDGTIIINRWVKEPYNIAVCGDLLMTCKGTVGKMAVLKEDKVHIARQIMSVRVLPKMSRDYMQVCLLNYVALLNRKAKSIIPGIERKNVLNLMIPLPPIEEQRRIVEKLNQILPHIDDLKEAI